MQTQDRFRFHHPHIFIQKAIFDSNNSRISNSFNFQFLLFCSPTSISFSKKKKKEFPCIFNLSIYLCLKVEHPCSNFILSETLLKFHSSSPLTRNFHIFSSSTNPNPLTLIKVEAPTSHQFSSLFSFL